MNTNISDMQKLTVNDLAKSFLTQCSDDKDISFGRLQAEIDKEMAP